MFAMSDALVRTVALSTAAVVVMVTGIVLTRLGWPFGVVLLTVHKLVALIAVVFVGYLAFGAAQNGSLALGEWAILVATLTLCLAVFATGGVVSAMRDSPSWVLWTHRVGSWFAVVAVALSTRVAI
ncbi:MAG: hypothetical protein ACYC6C_05510 [Coriobacteriia bacterium]